MTTDPTETRQSEVTDASRSGETDSSRSDAPVVACILAGGTGDRLYPLSRPNRPKQLLAFGGEQTLLERTVDRVSDIADQVWILTSAALEGAVRKRVPDATVLVEPASLGTGPAAVYAAWHARDTFTGPEPVLLTLPSDQYVEDRAAFVRTLEDAVSAARETDGLVTIGVEPTRPATGFGYVVPERPVLSIDDSADTVPVAEFREKPNVDTARSLLADGARWNAGVFAWTPRSLLRATRDTQLESMVKTLQRDDGPETAYHGTEPCSVDRAILEGTDDAYVVSLPAAVGWDDLGTWDALGRVRGDGEDGLGFEADSDGNVTLETDIEVLAATDNVVVAPEHDVSLLGVENLAVAVVDGKLLVTRRSESERVGELCARAREHDRDRSRGRDRDCECGGPQDRSRDADHSADSRR